MLDVKVPSNNYQIQQMQSPKADTKEQQEIRKMSEPFCFSRLLYKYPCIIFLVFFVASQLLISAVMRTHFKIGEETERDFLVWSDSKVEDYDAFDVSRDAYIKELEKQNKITERSIEEDSTFIFYKLKKGKTLLTPENLKTMQKVEKFLTTYSNKNQPYQNFCLSTSNTDLSCEEPLSLPLLVVGDYDTQPTQNAIDRFLSATSQNDGLYGAATSIFDKDFSRDNHDIKVGRSIFKIGFPLNGFNTVEDDDQDEKFEEWNQKFLDYIEEDQSTSDMEVVFFNFRSITQYSSNQIKKDLTFAMMALVFVTIYMMIHTKSFAIGLMGMLIMLITFPLSFFFYRMVFQITYFISLHTSIIFLLMGIGADDVFVYFDSWDQAKQIPYLKDDLLKTISYSYRRASKAMLTTSATTVIAFLATAISKLMPIMTYGIFAAINITINYLLIISFFPCFLILREKFFIWKNKRGSSKVSDDGDWTQRQQGEEIIHNHTLPVTTKTGNDLQSQVNNQLSQDSQKQESKVIKFFATTWTNFTYKARYIIMLVFFAIMVFNINGALMLGTPDTPPTMLKEDHFLQKAQDHLREDFTSTDGQQIKVFLVWGISGIDKDDVSYYEPDYAGEPEYHSEQDFDITLTTSQSRIIDICNELRKEQHKQLVLQESYAIECYMEDFKTYVESKGTSFPVQPSNFNTELGLFLDSNQGYQARKSNYIGFIDGKVKHFAIAFQGNELTQNPRDVLKPLYDKYEYLLQQIKSDNPQGLKKVYQTSQAYLWMVSEKAILDSAIQGILISLSLAFVVLVLSTQNIIMSFYSIICIIGVVLGSMCVIWLRGWEFGTFESTNIIIVIGLSVDYVVHLTNSYVESHQETRYEKTREMLATMGVSVLGGGMTTLGAGLFLFGGQLRILNVMGLLVCSTIGFSLLWALVFFPALCHIIGAEENQGNLKYYFGKCCNSRNQSQK